MDSEVSDETDNNIVDDITSEQPDRSDDNDIQTSDL